MVKKKIMASSQEQVNQKQNDLIEERKERFFGLFKNNISLAAIIILLVIVIYSFNVRTSNVPNLKDVTTGNYTLGPDLDPFLFLRWAKDIAEHGSLMKNDTMRYYPLGYDTSAETLFVPYSIAYLYNILHFFDKSVTVEYAAVIYAAVFFALAVIAFFFFTRRLFVMNSEIKRNLIALIATAFFIVMPSLLHRTVAGIPEKEAGGIFFIFLLLYFFIASLQTKTNKGAIVFGILAGLSTGTLGLTWGGVTFAILGIGLAMFVCFILEIAKGKEYVAYLSWIFSFSLVMAFLTKRYGGFIGLITSTTTFVAYLTGVAIIMDFLLSKYIYKRIENKIRLPKKIFSLIITIIVGIIFFLIFNPGMAFHILNDIKVGLLHPQGTDRIALTVAENNQPYFSSWTASYDIRFFWIFIAAAVLLFHEAISGLKRLEKYLLSGIYFLFLVALIFSRYSQNNIMNGTSTLSQTVYFGGFFIFASFFAFIYINAQKSEEVEKIKIINIETVTLLSLFFWAVVSARGAIRLFFLLDPIVAILAAFIAVDLPYRAIKSKSDTLKMTLWIIASIFVISALLLSFYNFVNITSNEARGTIPSAYTIQWQYAMKWVRDNTTKDSVFVHWWDYGYWLQTIGERTTVVDGGNSIGYWDYLVGRHVLTGQNETEALEFLKTHNVSYLLIDPTDIGKYPAYSSIGSDLDYDRYNWITTMMMDERQTQETRNGTIYVYQGGTVFDKDFVWYDTSTKQQYLFPQQSSEAIIAGVLLKTDKVSIGNMTFSTIEQPTAVIIHQGSSRIEIPLCYLYYENKMTDFKSNGPCMPATLYIIPTLTQSSGGGSINYMGSALFLNEKALNALWVKLYLLNQTQNFELAHSEQSYVVKQLRQQGLNVPDFVYYGDINGPIKIWRIKYPEGIEFKPEYLERGYPDTRLLVARGN